MTRRILGYAIILFPIRDHGKLSRAPGVMALVLGLCDLEDLGLFLGSTASYQTARSRS